MTDVELGVAWAVPAGWVELAEDVSPPPNEPILRRAWSDQPDTALGDGSSDFTAGVMLLTLTVDSEDALPFPPERSRPEKTIWGQEIFVGEISGEAASPFDLRLSSFALQTPYLYHLELGCAPPSGADDAARQEFEANCRNIWHFVSSPFGTCQLPLPPAPTSDSRQQASNEYYGYSFEVPGEWLRNDNDGRTPDRLDFLSDPTAWSIPRPCVLPNGLMKLDFSVNPPGNFEPADGPDLTRFQEVPGATPPTWTINITNESGTSDIGAGGVVRGPEYWYSFGLYCWPPHGADAEGQAAFQAQCDATMAQILDSFQLIK